MLFVYSLRSSGRTVDRTRASPEEWRPRHVRTWRETRTFTVSNNLDGHPPSTFHRTHPLVTVVAFSLFVSAAGLDVMLSESFLCLSDLGSFVGRTERKA